MLKVAGAITIIALFLSIQAPVFAMTRGPADILVNTPSGQTAYTEILPTTSDYVVNFAYRDTEFEEFAKQDLSIAYIYLPRKAHLETIWVTLEIASARTSLHRWEACLVSYPLSQGWKPQVVQLQLEDIQLSENPLIFGRYFIFENTSSTQIQSVLYWYESATFETGSTSEQKTMKISIISYPNNLQNLESIKNQQSTLAESIIAYWEPIKLWSTITMVISKNGGYLATTTTLLLAAVILFCIIETIRQRKTSRTVYSKLSIYNKRIVDAIGNAKKMQIATIDNIKTAYQKMTVLQITREHLIQKLEELEKERIIERQIENYKDEPTQTWKV
jgi:hypothetical protein